MFDEKDGYKSHIRILSKLKESIKSAIVVEPTERAFNLPALVAIFLLSNVFGWTTE